MQKDERVQVALMSKKTFMTCWVDKHVKVGNKVTLKDSDDPTELWEVLKVSEPVKASSIKSNRDYKVGGL